jgi:thiamine transporter ThiT
MKTTKKLTLSAMFIAIGLVLPFVTGQVPQIGRMLLPMHIPVFLCGMICGWKYGAGVGFILPPMRAVLFGMPVLFPSGIAMAFELAAYGLVSGLLYDFFTRRSGKKLPHIVQLYLTILAAMVTGRIVWGVAEIILLGISGSAFTWKAFLAGALFNAVPGIIIQLVLLPAVMTALKRTRLIPVE